jgi:hypothetical protein
MMNMKPGTDDRACQDEAEKRGRSMWRLIKVLFFLVVLAAIGLIGYAYIGPVFFAEDFAAPQHEVVQPVTLGVE